MLKAEEAKNPRSEKQSGRMTVYFLTLYRFQGSESESLKKLECTLKTAQPDGKHLVKKPVANVFKRTHERRNANNFAVGLRRNKLTQSENFDSYSD